MLCTIPRGDIVLGYDGHQIGITDDLVDFLGLALSDKSTKSILPAKVSFRFCVHGFVQTVVKIEPEQ
jgi:hypothetical protein